MPDSAADRILDLYPGDPSQGIPAFLGDARVSSMGNQWRRVSAYVGDSLMHANRRKQCEAWANSSTRAYCYRFNVHSNDIPLIYGATHFEEVAFVFNNIDGVVYHYGKPFNNTPNSYKELSRLMATANHILNLEPRHLSQGKAQYVQRPSANYSVSGIIALKEEVKLAVLSIRVGAGAARLELAVLALKDKPVRARMAHVAHPLH